MKSRSVAHTKKASIGLNTPESLADQIVHRAQTTADNENVNQARTLSRRVSRYSWPEVAPRLDENILLSLDNT